MKKIIFLFLFFPVVIYGQRKDSSKFKIEQKDDWGPVIQVPDEKEYTMTREKLESNNPSRQVTDTSRSNNLPPKFTDTSRSDLLSIAVLSFGLILCIAVMFWLFKMKKGIGNFSFKTLGIILILTACLFLVVAGYDLAQISPVIGLLGTIAGFIFGSSGNSNSSSGQTGNPPQ